MKLTDLRPGVSGDRVVLLFEDGKKLRVSRLTAAEYSLTPGMELSQEEYAALSAVASKTAARDRAVRIVSSTNVSKSGLTRRLVQKGQTPEQAEDAVRWLEDLYLLDDRRTGEAVVRSALGKGYGLRRIRQVLQEKEIPREYWEELLSDLPPMDEAVDKLLRQKLGTAQPDQKQVQRAVDALLRRGHSWQDIRAGLERFRLNLDLEDIECL